MTMENRRSVNEIDVFSLTMPNNESSSFYGANKVASCNDLVTKILSPLTVRTLLRFKSVSKHWYSLITNHTTFNRINPDPPSGLFVPQDYSYIRYEFVPFDVHNPVKLKPDFKPLNRSVTIRDSCNGLILCSHVNSEFTTTYYLYNPSINQFTTLPEPQYLGSVLVTKVAFDPVKSLHYKIIYVSRPSGTKVDYNCQIDIYSSETRTFKPSYKLSVDQLYELEIESCVYWNNTLHWLKRRSGFLSYFNLDQEGGLNHIRTPFGLRDMRNSSWRDYSIRIFESRDHMLLVEIDRTHTLEFNIHELRRDYSGWFVKFHIDLHQLGTSFPEIIHPDHCARFQFDILSVVLGEKEDESFVVLEIPYKAVRFNLVSKTYHKLHDFTSLRPLEYNGKSYLRLGWSNAYQFMESLYSF